MRNFCGRERRQRSLGDREAHDEEPESETNRVEANPRDNGRYDHRLGSDA